MKIVRHALLFSFLFYGLFSCYVWKAYKYRNFELKDIDKFDAAKLPASPKPFRFAVDTIHQQGLKQYLDSNLVQSQSYAFLVIRHDTILYERYFNNAKEETKLPSFSVAKSVTSTLVGIALHEGKIKSLDEPITNYLPELRKQDKRFYSVTIQQVLDMRSGIKSNEDYANPFSDVLKMGFARNVSKLALKATTEAPPGDFNYKSVNTQLLALIVEKATGEKLQDYAVEKLWQPLQTEHEATWNVDAHNTVRAFCCINAAARDYAKFGRLFLHNGWWQGVQLVPEEWVMRSTNVDTMETYDGYKNQWWASASERIFSDSLSAVQYKIPAGAKYLQLEDSPARNGLPASYVLQYRTGAYHAEGILGQFVYVYPAKDIIIVRLGHYWSHPGFDAKQFIYNLGEML